MFDVPSETADTAALLHANVTGLALLRAVGS